MVHQIFLKWAMEKDLLMPYAKDLDTWQYVTSPFAKSSLGVNVEGYVMPMFHSQTALAYNPDHVKDPPQSYEELVAWVEKNPGKSGQIRVQRDQGRYVRRFLYGGLDLLENGKI